jgi:hypothetical protein
MSLCNPETKLVSTLRTMIPELQKDVQKEKNENGAYELKL